MILYLCIAAAVLLLIVAAVFSTLRRGRKPHPRDPSPPTPTLAPLAAPITIRQAEIDEEATIVAQEYRRAADEAHRSVVRDKALDLLTE